MVAEARHQIYSKLERRFGKKYIVVETPDHPYLLGGPDIIVAREGELYAVFCIYSSERVNPNLLLYRLALTRLAYPVGSLCLLCSTLRFSNYFNHFDLYGGPSKVIDAITNDIEKNMQPLDEGYLVKSKTKFFYNTRYLSSVAVRKDEAYRQSNSLLEESALTLKSAGFASAVVDGWVEKKRFGGKYIFEREDSLVGIYPFESIRNIYNHFSRFFLFGLMKDFKYDRGLLYRNNGSSRARIIYSDILPQYKFDPEKPLRAAAFAGWTIMPSDYIGQVDFTIEHLRKDSPVYL